MTPARPPRLAEWLVARSVPAIDRVAVLGDLAEEFDALASVQGRARASRWYWRQALASLVPNLRRRMAGEAPTPAVSSIGSIMDSLWLDARFGGRMLRRKPLVTTVALISLIVGISMSTLVFSLLDAAVLSPLPVSKPRELALMLGRRAEGVNHNFSYPDFTDYRAGQKTFTDLVAYSRAAVTIRQPSGASVVNAELVSGSFFSTLGVPMRFGRGLTDADDRSDAAPVVVVSDSLWRLLAPGDTSFEPRSIQVNGGEFMAVGVVDAPFHGMNIGGDVRLWAALNQQPLLDPSGGRSLMPLRNVSWLSVVGRLRAGVTRDTAAADLNRIETVLGPSVNRPEPRTLLLEPGQQGDSSLPKITASPLRLLLGAALLVLVVACANVANLLVARTADRGREFAVRTALGATRGRIARLLLIEALLLGAVGSAAGLVVARWLADLAVPLFADFGQTVALDLSVNWRVVLFVTGAGVGATMMAGLVALFNLRPGLAGRLNEGGRAVSSGRSAARIRRGLVVVQFALSLALVVAATLLVRTLENLRSIPTGFDIDHVALLSVDPEAAHFDVPRIRQYLGEAAARLARVPGVSATGYGRVIPMSFGGWSTGVFVPGEPRPTGENVEVNLNAVSPGYFEATGITILVGRSFDAGDTADRPPVAVINESMARQYWPNQPATGRTFHLGDQTRPSIEVVGVARDVKYRMLREAPAPSFYLPIDQTRPHGGVMHVRTAGDPAALLETLRRALAEVDPAVPVTAARTLRDQTSLNVNDDRVATTIGLSLAIAALLLAAVGLYGAMSYSVAQRTREIGVRLALGAVPAHVRRIVLGQGLRLALAGSAVGLALGFWMGKLVESRLYGVRPGDVTSFAVSAGVLTVVALVACWAPARRAMRVDPVVALRQD